MEIGPRTLSAACRPRSRREQAAVSPRLEGSSNSEDEHVHVGRSGDLGSRVGDADVTGLFGRPLPTAGAEARSLKSAVRAPRTRAAGAARTPFRVRRDRPADPEGATWIRSDQARVATENTRSTRSPRRHHIRPRPWARNRRELCRDGSGRRSRLGAPHAVSRRTTAATTCRIRAHRRRRLRGLLSRRNMDKPTTGVAGVGTFLSDRVA